MNFNSAERVVLSIYYFFQNSRPKTSASHVGSHFETAITQKKSQHQPSAVDRWSFNFNFQNPHKEREQEQRKFHISSISTGAFCNMKIDTLSSLELIELSSKLALLDWARAARKGRTTTPIIEHNSRSASASFYNLRAIISILSISLYAHTIWRFMFYS